MDRYKYLKKQWLELLSDGKQIFVNITFNIEQNEVLYRDLSDRVVGY